MCGLGSVGSVRSLTGMGSFFGVCSMAGMRSLTEMRILTCVGYLTCVGSLISTGWLAGMSCFAGMAGFASLTSRRPELIMLSALKRSLLQFWTRESVFGERVNSLGHQVVDSEVAASDPSTKFARKILVL